MDITLLNVDLQAADVHRSPLSEGSFGSVIPVANGNHCPIPCLSKRMLLKGSWRELKDGETSWYLCSLSS